jgi:hypothetical protein
VIQAHRFGTLGFGEPNDFDLRHKGEKRSGAVMTLAVSAKIGSGLRVI